MAIDTSRIMSENIILIDSTYTDKVAFDLSVNFERMIGRSIPKADLAHWLDCIALDGGLTPGDNSIQVIFIHDKQSKELENLTPGNFEKDINGKAFKDNIGEFEMGAFPVENSLTNDADFFLDMLQVLIDNESVKKIMVIPNVTKYGNAVCNFLQKNKGKDVTLFAMEPQMGTGFNQQIIGYSLMSALGIRSEELR